MRILKVVMFCVALISASDALPQKSFVNVAVVLTDHSVAEKKELIAFSERNPSYRFDFLTVSQLHTVLTSRKFDVVWIHHTDVQTPLRQSVDSLALETIRQWYARGGALLATMEAIPLIALLGLDPVAPDVQTAEARDEGYGRKRGLHSNASHPLFDGLHGGSFVFSPLNDTAVRRWGYFGNELPANGKVVAVDWAYIRLKEKERLVIDYRNDSGGKALFIGAYCALRVRNQHQRQLDAMLGNALDYLAGNLSGGENYWPVNPFVYKDISESIGNATFGSSEFRAGPLLWPTVSKTASAEYAGLAGERMAVFSNETSGIEEVWSHPFMVMRDFRIGIRSADSIRWLKAATFQSDPVTFRRVHELAGCSVVESVMVHPSQPLLVVHYAYDGTDPIEMVIDASTNLRLMWPYSPDAAGGLQAGLSPDGQLFVASDPGGQYVAALGLNRPSATGYSVDSVSKKARVRFRFRVEPNSTFDFLAAAGTDGMSGCLSQFSRLAQSPSTVLTEAGDHFRQWLNERLIIESPDTLFNRMYVQTLAGTDRFFATTPGIGSSFLAGYASTAHGWDGEQAVNGRPGYAWYFGRDAQWSSMAVLGYGDFEKVKEVLKTFALHQDLNGKIYHELTTSGAVHYDASDATPLYLVLAGRYLLHTGDRETIALLWPSLQRAIDFCYSTDTDHDLLIENTGVGHGWVEGGHLFGGKTTLYLASCWAEALRMMALMVDQTGLEGDARQYQQDSEKVREQINRRFYNHERRWFNHSLKTDDTYIEDETIMQAIPLLFGQIDHAPAQPVLSRFASNSFSSDWGTRIVPMESPRFNPKGYHTGSVWPLYTGWTALAEYRNGRSLQGFQHLWNNLWITQFWGQGMIEEVMHGTEFRPSGVCAHQCWSHTLTLQPLIDGMLGFRPDAMHRLATLSPAVPAQWNTLKVKNIRVGNSVFGVNIERTGDAIVYQFSQVTGDPLAIILNPVFPEGSKVKRVFVNDQLAAMQELSHLKLNKLLKVELEMDWGMEVVPVLARPESGQGSVGLRILSQAIENEELVVEVEGLSGSINELTLRHDAAGILCDDADLKTRDGEFSTWRVSIPAGVSKEQYQQVTLRFRRL